MTGTEKGFKNQKVKNTQGIYNPLSKRLYTLPEAACYLGRSLWSMRELVWAGKISYVKDGKRVYVDILDLETYVCTNKMRFET